MIKKRYSVYNRTDCYWKDVCGYRNHSRSFFHLTFVALVFAVLFIGFVPAMLEAEGFPNPKGYVNDFADVIDRSSESIITNMAQEVEEKTGIEIAVATFGSLNGTYGRFGSIEQLSIELAEQWQVGKKNKDNGMLLVMVLKERKVRIEVGYGLEGIFPDGLVGRIRDTSIIPYFKNNKFSTGFVKAMEGITGVIAKEHDVTFMGVSSKESEKYTRTSNEGSGNIFPLIVFVLIFLFGGGRFFWPLLFLGGFSGRSYHRGGFGSSGQGGFGGFRSSGGGGFSGFGGGSFGGGGASGSF